MLTASAKSDFIKCQIIFQIKTFFIQKGKTKSEVARSRGRRELAFYDDLFAMKLIMRSQLRFNFTFIQCNVSVDA